MKILLAGMQLPDNQFSRALKRHGCEVVWTNPDPGPFPKFCEAAVIAKCQISHQKMWDVKEQYGAQNKPVFMSNNSFAAIEERFLEFVNKRKADIQSKTTLGLAFAQATPLLPPKPKPEPPKVEPMKKVAKTYYEPEAKKQIVAIIGEAMDAEMSVQETIEMLHAHNLKRSDASDFGSMDIYNLRSEIRKTRLKNPKPVVISKPAPIAPPKVGPPPVGADHSNSMSLFRRILQLNLPPDKTIQFQAWLLDGKINIEQALWFLDIVEARK